MATMNTFRNHSRPIFRQQQNTSLRRRRPIGRERGRNGAKMKYFEDLLKMKKAKRGRPKAILTKFVAFVEPI